MPITMPTTPTKLFDGTNIKFAISQPPVTTISLLYGVEVSSPSGFSKDPKMDIHVFNNAKAAKAFVETLDSTFDWTGNGLILPDVGYDTTTFGRYYVTAQRAAWNQEVPKAPIGISGCSYNDEPKPFIADVVPEYGLPTCGAFINVVVVINDTSAVAASDELVTVRTITESASK